MFDNPGGARVPLRLAPDDRQEDPAIAGAGLRTWPRVGVRHAGHGVAGCGRIGRSDGHGRWAAAGIRAGERAGRCAGELRRLDRNRQLAYRRHVKGPGKGRRASRNGYLHGGTPTHVHDCRDARVRPRIGNTEGHVDLPHATLRPGHEHRLRKAHRGVTGGQRSTDTKKSYRQGREQASRVKETARGHPGPSICVHVLAPPGPFAETLAVLSSSLFEC